MNICDYFWKREQKVVPARHVIDIDNNEQVLHLSDEALAEVLKFINTPDKGTRTKRK